MCKCHHNINLSIAYLNNGLRHNLIHTFLGGRISENFIKLISIRVPVILPEFQPFHLKYIEVFQLLIRKCRKNFTLLIDRLNTWIVNYMQIPQAVTPHNLQNQHPQPIPRRYVVLISQLHELFQELQSSILRNCSPNLNGTFTKSKQHSSTPFQSTY